MQNLNDQYIVNADIKFQLGQIGFLTVAKASRMSSRPSILYLIYALAMTASEL